MSPEFHWILQNTNLIKTETFNAILLKRQTLHLSRCFGKSKKWLRNSITDNFRLQMHSTLGYSHQLCSQLFKEFGEPGIWRSLCRRHWRQTAFDSISEQALFIQLRVEIDASTHRWQLIFARLFKRNVLLLKTSRGSLAMISFIFFSAVFLNFVDQIREIKLSFSHDQVDIFLNC